jgi:hypothetical protein
LEAGLVIHIDNLQGRSVVIKPLQPEVDPPEDQKSSPEKTREEYQDKVLKECEEFLQESRRLRNDTTFKATGKTKTGRINPLASARKDRRIAKERRARGNPKTEGIASSEVARRKAAGECLRCTWPANRKGIHQVKDCRRPIKLDIGTTVFPKDKTYQRQQPLDTISRDSESTDSEDNTTSESTDFEDNIE